MPNNPTLPGDVRERLIRVIYRAGILHGTGTSTAMKVSALPEVVADAILTEFTVLHRVPVVVPPTDLRPHSRACGIRKHEHGRECHSNCPTCGGSGVPREQVNLDPEPWEHFDGKRRSQPLNQESGNPYGVLWSFKPRPGYSTDPADYPKGTP